MLSKTMQDALNKQLNMELYSAYVYASLSAYFEHENLNGFAHWMGMQVQEEAMHAKKFYDYINDAGGRVVLDGIDKPPAEFESVVSVFDDVLKHERKVTKAIYKLVDLANKESDHGTHTFLQWFVSEQIEEEKVADNILQRLKMVAKSPEGLFMMDQELGSRTPAPAGGAV
jgi:ferritin